MTASPKRVENRPCQELKSRFRIGASFANASEGGVKR
jgi:hypothetical protein